ncbi:hypothetical protein CKM354_001256500 [Cercospora kikuchii]|uniref:Uncharacterized protein n=1 Tax=Cercospora kikuchii TaxID=84275 RepID=A0A9P3FM79_9PEZI|nr:uncharacterized protein CKM354_001256500 [Cercospora kikuchii]GIZ49535.1 hypothetical protein CKM354_001256500 [Cercospora kikuchii]
MVRAQTRLDGFVVLKSTNKELHVNKTATQQSACDRIMETKVATAWTAFSREHLVSVSSVELTHSELEETDRPCADTSEPRIFDHNSADTRVYNAPGFINGRTLDEIFTGKLELVSGSTLFELSKRYKFSTIEANVNLGRQGNTINTRKLHKELAKYKSQVLQDGSKCVYAFEYELNKARKFHGHSGVHMPTPSLRCGECTLCIQAEDWEEPEKVSEYWAGPKRAQNTRDEGGRDPETTNPPPRPTPTINKSTHKFPLTTETPETPQQGRDSSAEKKGRKLPWLTNSVSSDLKGLKKASKSTSTKRKLSFKELSSSPQASSTSSKAQLVQPPRKKVKLAKAESPILISDSETAMPAKPISPQAPIVIEDSDDDSEAFEVLNTAPLGNRRRLVDQLRQPLRPKSPNKLNAKQVQEGGRPKETNSIRITDFFKRDGNNDSLTQIAIRKDLQSLYD